MTWALYLVSSITVILLALFTWRQFDRRADQAAWAELADTNLQVVRSYSPGMVANLPEPARRYFGFTIAPGTPLHSVVRIEMRGEIGRGTVKEHSYVPMHAVQILAPPFGLVWKINTGALSGSDGAMPDRSWTRFWLFNLLPVVRAAGPDHRRSAFGRVIAEAAIWAPASLLPSDFVTWEPVNANTARAVVRQGDMEQALDITVDPSGAPVTFLIQRWSNENPERVFREQPFGGTGSDFRQFGGYRLPTRIEGGNHFGTADYFPFYKAEVTSVDPVGP